MSWWRRLIGGDGWSIDGVGNRGRSVDGHTSRGAHGLSDSHGDGRSTRSCREGQNRLHKCDQFHSLS
jgi:hypothetical protein